MNYTLFLLLFLLYFITGFFNVYVFFFCSQLLSAKILHGKTCVLLLTERNLSCVITCFFFSSLHFICVGLHAFTSRFVLLKFENCINGFLGFLSFLSFFPPSLLWIRLQLHTETKRSILNHSFFKDFLFRFFLILESICVWKRSIATRKTTKTHNR